MSTPELIEGKVARVLNSRELVINRGSDDGVKPNMLFEVLDPEASEIPDPDTGEVLGSVYRPKVPVRAVIVEPRLSVARTYRKRRVNVGGTGGIDVSALMRPPKWQEVWETFKSEEAAWEKISPAQSFVKVGDPVRQLVEPRRAEPKESEEAAEARGGS